MYGLLRIIICVLLFGVFISSCSKSDMDNSLPNVSPATGSINILVNLCDFLLDPLCQSATPLPAVNVFLFNDILGQDENKILREGSTNSEGRIIFDNLEPKTYYVTSSHESEIIKDTLTITQNTAVSYLEILYLK